MFLSVGCPACTPESAQHPVSGPADKKLDTRVTVDIIKPSDNPLNHALSLIGLTRNNLDRPRAHEAGYMLACRLPLIEQVAQSPFHLHAWADETSHRFQKAARAGLSHVITQQIMMMNGNLDYLSLLHPSSPFSGGLAEAYRYACGMHGMPVQKEVIDKIHRAGFRPEFDRMLGDLTARLSEASLLVQKALQALEKEELAYLTSRPERFFFPRDINFLFLTASTHTQTGIVNITRKIDFVSLYKAALTISSALRQFTEYNAARNTPGASAPYFKHEKTPTGIVLDIDSPMGDIVILGPDANTFGRPCALLVDLGGNDRYTGPVAVGHLVRGRVALAIDISGDDTYDNGKNRFAQGFGCLAVGVLADLAGNDRYIAGNMAQGVGIYGVGALIDGQGKDWYTAGLLAQGFGVFGTGTLLDLSGSDIYSVTGMGQGTGATMGSGLLCDTSGNDKYLADRRKTRGHLIPDKWSHAQGAALSIRSPTWTKNPSYYGGIGLLSEGGGDDLYWASDGGSMGAGYFMSIGALVDHDGNDKYLPQKMEAMGYAVHLASGVLIDRKGNDYYAGSLSGGHASDRSIAVLADYAGDDIYGPSYNLARQKVLDAATAEAEPFPPDLLNRKINAGMAHLSYGTALKEKSLGFLIDYRGNDQYYGARSGRGESCGGVLPPATPSRWGHAMLLDLSGQDTYYQDNRQDNRYMITNQHAICYDTEYDDPESLGKMALKPKKRFLTTSKLQVPGAASDVQRELEKLADPDLFVRYSAVGKMTDQGPGAAETILDLLATSPDEEINRDLLEILNTLILKRQMLAHNKFERLLTATDPLVQQYAIRTLGWWKIKRALPALIRALKDCPPGLRPDIVWAMARFQSADGVPTLLKMFHEDDCLECRRHAITGLCHEKFRHLPATKAIKAILTAALTDPDEIIRTQAAAGIAEIDPSPATLSLLSDLLQTDQSIYVKRAAAKSLILAGRKDAIPELIDTLAYRSIDTYQFYDLDLPKDLSFYCGIDFPEEIRYDHATWRNWWQENQERVNLDQNLVIMEKIQKAFSAAHEKNGILLFETLLVSYPHNRFIRNRYKRFCHEWIFFRLTTKENITPEILERCVLLQQKILALGPPEAAQWEQLASFYLQLSRTDDAIAAIQSALELAPRNTHLQNVLKQMRAASMRK